MLLTRRCDTLLIRSYNRNAATFQSRKNDQAQRTLSGRIQDASFQCMSRLANITDAVKRYSLPVSVQIDMIH